MPCAAARRIASVSFLVATFAAADGTSATPAPTADTHLSWVRTDDAVACPDAVAVMREVTDRLGWNPFLRDPPSGPARLVEVTVERAEGVWTARLRAQRAGGTAAPERRLTSGAPGCESLAKAAALAIALMIDPNAMSREASPPEPPRPVPPPGEPAERGAVTVAAFGAWNVLPRLAPGVDLGAELTLVAPVRVAVGLIFAPEVADDADARFRFGLTSGRMAACVTGDEEARVRGSLCGGFLVGALHAVASEVVPTNPGQRWFVAGELAARAAVPVSTHLALWGGVSGLVNVVRHRFFVEGSQREVFRQPAVGVLVQLGVQLLFR